MENAEGAVIIPSERNQLVIGQCRGKYPHEQPMLGHGRSGQKPIQWFNPAAHFHARLRMQPPIVTIAFALYLVAERLDSRVDDLNRFFIQALLFQRHLGPEINDPYSARPPSNIQPIIHGRSTSLFGLPWGFGSCSSSNASSEAMSNFPAFTSAMNPTARFFNNRFAWVTSAVAVRFALTLETELPSNQRSFSRPASKPTMLI